MIPFNRILVVSKIYYRYIETYFLIYIYMSVCVLFCFLYNFSPSILSIPLSCRWANSVYIYIYMYLHYFLLCTHWFLLSLILKFCFPFGQSKLYFSLHRFFSLYFKSVLFVCLLLCLAGDQLQSHCQFISLQKILIFDIYVFIL